MVSLSLANALNMAIVSNSIPVAEGSPRSNRPGVVPGSSRGRSSQIVTLLIPANKPIQLFQAGQQFYLTLASGAVKIKPNNGSENTYQQGKGQVVPLDNCFTSLQITNPNPFSVVISIFVGFSDYIDNSLILFNPQIANVVYPTYPVSAAAANLLIPDLSGSAFFDSNGTEWLALSRVSIYISNIDTGLTYNLQNTAANKTLLSVFPATNVTLPFSGNFRITDGATLKMIVSEVYMAVLPGVS